MRISLTFGEAKGLLAKGFRDLLDYLSMAVSRRITDVSAIHAQEDAKAFLRFTAILLGTQQMPALCERAHTSHGVAEEGRVVLNI